MQLMREFGRQEKYGEVLLILLGHGDEIGRYDF